MMKIAVFGAAGWLGRAILAGAEGRAQVRAFDRGPEAWDEWNDIDGEYTAGEVLHGDISDFDAVTGAAEDLWHSIHPGEHAFANNRAHEFLGKYV